MFPYQRFFTNASEVNHALTRTNYMTVLLHFMFFVDDTIGWGAEQFAHSLATGQWHAVAWSHSHLTIYGHWCNNGSFGAEPYIELKA